MFLSMIIFTFIITASMFEFSTQHQKMENENDLKRNDANRAKLLEETLEAVRIGNIRGFRRGINRGDMKPYADVFKGYSYQRMKKMEEAMNNKMFTIERLIASNLTVPASKDQPHQYHFNVTLLPGTDIITQLSLNLDALENWDSEEKPLHMLCSLPDVEPRIVMYLLDKGFDLNERSKWNDTVLELAAYHGNLALVKFLVEKGADPKSTVQFDLYEYKGRNYHRFIKVFSSKDLILPKGLKVNYNSLSSAISGGHLEVVKYIISLGADLNEDNQSWALLFDPVIDGNADLLELLLKSGCDVNGRDVMGATALHMAADRGHLQIAKLLLDNGADVTAIDNFGWTPLHVAAFSSQNVALVELLVEAGASINATTDRGFTPLILAEAGSKTSFLSCLTPAITSNFRKNIGCEKNSKTCKHQDHIYILTFLCSRGVNTNHNDDAIGWSVLHWASATGDEKAARFLVEKCAASVEVRSKAGHSPSDVAKYFGSTALQNYQG